MTASPAVAPPHPPLPLAGAKDRPGSGQGEEADPRRLERRLDAFFLAVVVVAVAFACYHAAASRPEIFRGSSGAVVVGLVALFLLFYGAAVRRLPEPAPGGLVLLYGVAQLAVIAGLQRFHPDFGSLAVPLTAHLMGLVPVRLWPLAAIAPLAVAGVGWDFAGSLRAGDVEPLVGALFQWLLWVALFAVLIVLIRQSERLTATVGELRRAEAELRRHAAEAAELATLRERTRLAREMHDSLGHALVAVNVKLEVAERFYGRAGDPARGAEELRQTRALVRQAMVELRRSLADLRAPLPPAGDLPTGLRRLAEELGDRGGPTVALDLPAAGVPLPPDVAAALWQVGREALLNVERHAAARSVVVGLDHGEEEVVLRVVDDGVGLGPTDIGRPGHYGIAGMRERVEALAGRPRVAPGDGGGTVVEATVPRRMPTDPALAEAQPVTAEPAGTAPLLAEART